MATRLKESVERWCDLRAISDGQRPDLAKLEARVAGLGDPLRPPASRAQIESWESRYGFRLPEGLRDWLSISNGFHLGAPFVHPLAAIGPMVPFAKWPGLIVQPESWFELGNPNVETVCFDLAYLWPGGDFPVFTSGDDQTGSPPKIIAASFDDWFLGLLSQGGREYWFDGDFEGLGDPWERHRRHVPPPPIAARLVERVPDVENLLRQGRNERMIGQTLGLSRMDVEAVFRYIQHQR